MNFLQDDKHLDEIYVYKIEFSMNLFQQIISNRIYEHLYKEYKILLELFSRGSIGGFFEVLINFYFIKSDSFEFKLFNIQIEQILQLERLVPIEFSIKNYSSKRKKKKLFKKIVFENITKQKLLNKTSYILQSKFNAKYYDSAILVKTNDPSVYDLILFQIIIKKDSDKRYNIYEHELIISWVKKYLEIIFGIKIRSAYFFYILSEKNGQIEDIDTKNECGKIGIKYLSYDFEKKKVQC